MLHPTIMQTASNIRGTVTLQISDEGGTKTISVPDPGELPRGLPLSPSHKHTLSFIRDSIEPCPTLSTSEIARGSANKDSKVLVSDFAHGSLSQADTTPAGDCMQLDNGLAHCSAMGFRGCTQETPNPQPQET